MKHKDHLVMMMAHTYTPMLLVEGGVSRRIVTYFDTYIQRINRAQLTRNLIPQKLMKAETDISSLLDGLHCVVISYDLLMSKTTQEIFQ